MKSCSTIVIISILTSAYYSPACFGQCELVELSELEEQNMEDYGRAIVLRDDYVAVGRDWGLIEEESFVLLYRRDGLSWVPAGTLSSGVVNEENNFGEALAGDDTRLIIADCREIAPVPDGVRVGAVYIYIRQGNDFDLEQKVTAADTCNNFGRSVAISGSRIIVGTKADIGELQSVGSVYFFEFLDGSWIETQHVFPPPEDVYFSSGFGHAVSLAGDVALVGQPNNDTIFNNAGAAFIYRWHSGLWRLEQEFYPPSGPAVSFGTSVALDAAGDTALIGARNDLNQDGSAYVFQYVNGEWTMQQKLVSETPPAGPWAFFGSHLALNDAGDTAVIGATSDWGSGGQAGAAYIFREIDGVWQQIVKLLPPEGVPTSVFGGSVAIRGDFAAVGAPGGFGEAYVYGGVLGLDCNENKNPDTCDIFEGASLDLDGDGVPDECPVPADLNNDGAVDMIDYSLLANCTSGAGVTDPPADCDADVFAAADLDNDGDVDLDDYALFHPYLIGPAAP